MAVTWDIDIYNVDVDSQRADVRATRTDDQLEPASKTYAYSKVPLGTAQERQSILDQIKAQVGADALRAASVSAFVDTLEADGKTNLEAWELTR